MVLPSVWQLLLPSFNTTTIIGIILILLAIFGGPVFRFIGKLLSTATGGKVKDGFIVSFLVVTGIILVWGVSIAQDLLASKEFLLILVGVIFLVAIIIFAFRTRDNDGVFR